MKKFVLLLLILPLTLAYGQKKPKIKGNREVITRSYTLPPFLRVETSEEISITIKKAPDVPQIQLRADENLHEVLKWDVNDGTLKLWLSKKIISKKKFVITLFVDDGFEGIVLHNYAKIETEDKIRLQRLFIELHDRARVSGGFDVRDTVGIKLGDNAYLRTDLEAEKVRAVLDKDATWEGHLYAKQLDLKMSNSADFKMSGNLDNLMFDAGERAELGGYKLNIKDDAQMKMTDKAVARIHGKNAGKLIIYLDKSAALNVSGDFSHYEIKSFKDSATLQHVDK